MEREPVRFFVELLEERLDASRNELARFIRTRPEDLVFVPNATTGVATALAAVEPMIGAGDELLAPAHEYPACLNNLRRTAARRGASVVIAAMPFPTGGGEELRRAVLDRVTARTKVALLSHVTSPSAIRLPVERLVPELRARGVVVIVDGAHAPGQVADLDVGGLGAAFYTANAHKWLCTPKGSAFLHVGADWHERTRPLVLSNNAEKPRPGRSRLHTEFDYVGTNDVTAWLAVNAGIGFMGGLLAGGWPELMRRNHALAVEGRALLCRELGVEPPAPEDLLGSMATIVLPPHDGARAVRLAARPTRHHDALQDLLIGRWGIQVPVWSAASTPGRFVRISAQAYNSREQYEYLARALREELAREREL